MVNSDKINPDSINLGDINLGVINPDNIKLRVVSINLSGGYILFLAKVS